MLNEDEEMQGSGYLPLNSLWFNSISLQKVTLRSLLFLNLALIFQEINFIISSIIHIQQYFSGKIVADYFALENFS